MSENRFDRHVETALKAIWDAMPWGLKIKMPNGEEATLEKFVAPQRDEDGGWQFGYTKIEDVKPKHYDAIVAKADELSKAA